MNHKVISYDEFSKVLFNRLLKRRLLGRDWRCKDGKPVFWTMDKGVITIRMECDRRFAFAKDVVVLAGNDVELLADATIGWLLSLTNERGKRK